MTTADPKLLAQRWPFWRCVRFGFYMGCVYAVVALIAYSQMKGFEKYYGASVLHVIAIDLLGGLAGGTIVGTLLPRIRGLVGYVVTAVAAVTPAFTLVALSTLGVQEQTIVDGLIAAVLVGSGLGFVVWVRERKNR